MFEKYFAEFYVSEQELKEKIYTSLKFLNELEPEKWSADLLEYADPNKSSQEIVFSLTDQIPELSRLKLSLAHIELIESLKLTAIQLRMLLNENRLNHYFIKQLYMNWSTFLLGFRYLLASEVLSRKLGKELIYDQDKIYSVLVNATSSNKELSELFLVVSLANEEIKRLLSDESAKQYLDYIFDFEEAVEKYIKDNCKSILSESFMRLVNEGLAKNLNMAESNFQFGDSFSTTDIKELAENLFKALKQNTKIRLEIKGRGGYQGRTGFVWTDENKIAFYNMVESLQKKDSKYNWQFALDELKEAEFDFETTRWLRTRPNIKDFPEDLFNKAIKAWRKYLPDENWEAMTAEDKPRAFEYRHALYLLEIPDEFQFSTLDTYYYHGKKMVSDNQNENLKIRNQSSTFLRIKSY